MLKKAEAKIGGGITYPGCHPETGSSGRPVGIIDEHLVWYGNGIVSGSHEVTTPEYVSGGCVVKGEAMRGLTGKSISGC